MPNFHNWQKINSTIFKTENDKLTIFGKTSDEVKEKWNNFQTVRDEKGLFGKNGAFSTLFSGKSNIIDDSLLGDAEAFKDLFNESSLSARALAEDLGGVDDRIVEYAKTCKNGEFTMEGFTSSLNNSSKAAAAGMKALSIAGNALLSMAISWGISKLIEGIDNYVHRFENAVDSMEEAHSEYIQLKNDVASLNDELKTTNENDESKYLS